jgi:peptidoglycan/xylan/chitin deacetylase (PgdA/CDA1 family)
MRPVIRSGRAAGLSATLFAALLMSTACTGSGGSSGDDGADDGGDDGGDGGDDGGDGGDDGGDGGDGGDDGGGDGLGPWDGNDNVAPSQDPPGGIAVRRAPLFVSFGWDDNGYSGLEGTAGTGGMSWATQVYASRKNKDNSPARATFYLTATYGSMWISESPTYVKRAWNKAYVDGHEIGNHTFAHADGAAFAKERWLQEMNDANARISKPFSASEPNTSPDDGVGVGVPADEVYGFRTPFLGYNDAMLQAVSSLDFWYDCSIEEGFEYDQDGTNFFWPYTLNSGSPGHDIQVEWGSKAPIGNYPGLWELPVYVVIVPPDSEAGKYGIPTGLRAKLKGVQSWFDVESGKITGFDYNLWVSFKMNKAEFLATMKYSLDQRLKGNRAPFLFGTHTDYYSSKYTAPPNATVAERQAAIEEFIDYAISKPEVRVTSAKAVLDWIRNPKPL